MARGDRGFVEAQRWRDGQRRIVDEDVALAEQRGKRGAAFIGREVTVWLTAPADR